MLRSDDILYGLNVNEIARICKVDITTARRWKRGAKCPPETALMILARDLGCLHPNWEGWTINRRGELCSPENWIATPGAVLAGQFHQSQLATYRTENRALKAALAAKDVQEYEEQPMPEQWEFGVG